MYWYLCVCDLCAHVHWPFYCRIILVNRAQTARSEKLFKIHKTLITWVSKVSDHEFDIKIGIQYGDHKKVDKNTLLQCFQRKILQNQQISYSGVFKIFDEEFDLEFVILYDKIADIETYFSSFSWFSLKKTTNSIELRVLRSLWSQIRYYNRNSMVDGKKISMDFNEKNCKININSCIGVFRYIITSLTWNLKFKEVAAR